jgi:UDPglucose 6-dehydrogenase
MDIRSSEMTKYAANSMLATRISFMNQVANLCELTGADVMKVMRGIGSDSRIGPKFLFPGIGFGGACFPKDVLALIKTSHDYGYQFSILERVLEVNQGQRILFLERIKNHFGNGLQGKHFAVWGLSFKANTDDMREAPAITILQGLSEQGVTCAAYDPKAIENAERIFEGNKSITFGRSQYDVLKDADALLLLTEWLSFREPDFERMKTLMKSPLIFDGRNQYNPATVARQGFKYICIGRGRKNV